MNQAEIQENRNCWNRKASAFESVYSGQKTAFSTWLVRTYYRDMFHRFRYTMEHCEPVAGRAFLDVGCGSGYYSLALLKRGAAWVTGLDVAEAMLQLCNQAAREAQVFSRCEFLHTDLLEYKPMRQFDITVGIGLFDYIRDPVPVLRKMRELSTLQVLVSFPRRYTWRTPVRKLRVALRRCKVYFYSRGQVESLMREAGYTAWKVETVGKLFCVTGNG
jgi:SAM-dependent methyltransferase